MYRQGRSKEKSLIRNEKDKQGWDRMAYGRKVEFEAVREVAFGGVGAAYAALGAILSANARQIKISNATDAEIYISFDGVTDHLRIVGNSFDLWDFTTNKVRDDGFFLANRTQIFQRRVAGAPTSGSLWVSTVIAGGGV